MNEEEYRISPWNSAWYSTTASASSNYKYMRERDLTEMYKIIEREKLGRPLKELKKYTNVSEVMARGTCTVAIERGPSTEDEFYNKLAEEKEEKKKEEFLFDPKELDV
jgi:hypothetical protein